MRRSGWLAISTAAMCLAATRAEAQRLHPADVGSRSAFAATAQSQGAASSCKRSKPRIVGQLALGLLGAWIGGIVRFVLIDDIDAPSRRVKGDAGYQQNANVAFAIGSWVGSTLGTFVVGRPGSGSLRRTAIGTGIPSLVLVAGYDEPYIPLIGVLFIAPLQALAGTLAW